MRQDISARSRLGWSVAVLFLAVIVTGVVTISAQQPQAGAGARIDGELLVQYRPGAQAGARARTRGGAGAALIGHFEELRIDHVRVTPGTEASAIAALRRDADVLIAEPNYTRQATAIGPPNDPYWLSDALWGLQRIMAQPAWTNFPISSTVVVADIDTGVNYVHPDLAASMWRNPGEVPGNGVDDDGNGYVDDVYGIDTYNRDSDPMDDHGHGTHTAGTIAAAGNNGIGVVGVNSGARILACKFLDASGNGSDAGAIACFNYVAALRSRGVNVRVTSNSWGAPRSGPVPTALKAAIDALGNAGVVNVFSAGNNGMNIDTTPFDPASLTSSSIVAVAASDESDNRAGFSNYGAVAVDLAAPGVSILSTYGGGYASSSGTSMAAPHVAGAASMVAALRPGASVATIKSILLDNVDHLGNWNGVVATGGRLNLFNGALAAYGNLPPSVAITAPTANASLTPGTVVTVAANATDSDGNVTTVAFFVDGTPLGVDSAVPYSIGWTPATPGTHALTAVATDNAGATTTSVTVSVNVVPAPASAVATFVRYDTTTQGSWLGSYGSQGFMLAGDAASLPSYAQATVSGQATHTWASTTGEVRGLQRPSGQSRFAATWYGSSFMIDVPMTDGAAHQIALYGVDWDAGGARAQRIDVLDTVSGAVLDSRTLSGFGNGQYLIWNVTGRVRFRVTNVGSPNAVISGLFFGDVPAAPPAPPVPSNAATFVTTDTTTQGTWVGTYGSQGYMLAGDATSLPAFAQAAVSGPSTHIWASTTGEIRGLQRPSGVSRLAATWYTSASFTIDVNLTDGLTHQIALYGVDWDAGGARADRIDVLDATSGAVLDSRTLSSFSNGQYLVWNVKGQVRFRVTNTGSPNAVVSGVFFGDAAAAPPPLPATAATFVRTDTTTQGTWLGTFGTQGYMLAGDATSMPAFAQVMVSGQSTHTWASTTSDVRGLQRPSGLSRLAATWYASGSFTIDVNLSDGLTHQIALYGVDWDAGGARAERVDVLDAGSGAVLDSRTLSSFAAGQYLVWTVRGHVRFRVTNTGSPNAAISGVFF